MRPGKDIHGTLGPDQREGRGWLMRPDSTVHSAETTPKMVAEQRRSRASALGVARRSTRTTTTNAEMLTIVVCTHAERAECASTACSVKCPICPGECDSRFQETDIDGGQECERARCLARRQNRREPLRKFVFEYPCW